jgi:hypothetical protein
VVVGGGPSKIMLRKVYGLMLQARAITSRPGNFVSSCKDLSGEKVSYFINRAVGSCERAIDYRKHSHNVVFARGIVLRCGLNPGCARRVLRLAYIPRVVVDHHRRAAPACKSCNRCGMPRVLKGPLGFRHLRGVAGLLARDCIHSPPFRDTAGDTDLESCQRHGGNADQVRSDRQIRFRPRPW